MATRKDEGMIDLEDLKLCYGSIKLIYLKREKFNELIQALEQAKEIISGIGKYDDQGDYLEAQEWISRYFTRKEEV